MTSFRLMLLFIFALTASCSLWKDSTNYRKNEAVRSLTGKRTEKSIRKKQKTSKDWQYFEIFISKKDLRIKGNRFGAPCKTSLDCSKDECCVLRRRKGRHVCSKMLLSGSRCNPFIIPGFLKKCPCAPGLTCTLKSFKRAIYKCVKIPANRRDEELDEDM